MAIERREQDVDRMTGLQVDLDLGGQNFPAGPINYRSKTDKTLGQWIYNAQT